MYNHLLHLFVIMCYLIDWHQSKQYYSVILSKYICHSGQGEGAQFCNKVLDQNTVSLLHMLMLVWTVLQVLNPCIKYCTRRCENKNSTAVWFGPKYVCYLRGYNFAIMTWIKIWFPFIHMSNAAELCCMNSTKMCDGRIYGHNCAIMTWIK